MPFEPRIVSPDDERWQGEATSDLPPDLEAVAERLRSDAAMLAERYPGECSAADVCPPSFGPSIGPSDHRASRGERRWWSAAAAAAITLTLLAAGWTVWRWASPASEEGDRAAHAVVADGVGRVARIAEPVEEDPAPVMRPVDVSLEFGRAETLLMNVNGPELEAVLDLMETQDTEDPLLSL